MKQTVRTKLLSHYGKNQGRCHSQMTSQSGDPLSLFSVTVEGVTSLISDGKM